ncbi:retrovirus-related pol polyprotein from transposon TNT 1-94 [Tanacetum coccineum]
MKKIYCLVVTDDYSRFSWVFLLASKDEICEILKTFISGIENLIDLKVKVIRCDNGTEFKNRVMNQFCEMKGNESNGNAGTKACDDTGKARMETVPGRDYILLPLISSSLKDSLGAGFKPSGEEEKKDAEAKENEDSEVPNTEEPRVNQEKDENVNNTNNINTVSSTINAASIKDNVVDENIVYGCDDDPNMPNLEEIIHLDNDEGIGAEADRTNLDTNILISPIPTTRIHKDHPAEQIIRDLHSAPHTRRMTYSVTDHVEPKKVYRNKKDERDIVIRNKARLVAHGYTQQEGIDYDEFFASVARIEAIRLFLAYASFKDFIVYKMDVKSAFMYGKIEDEVYVYQPSGKEMCTEFEKIMQKRFQMSSMGELTFSLGLQVTQKEDVIFISQDKYVDEILKKFSFSTVKTASTPMETSKPLIKDSEAEDVDVHLYRSMIGSLMYLTASRPDIIYLKGQHKLGLWYPKDSPFDLEAYTDSDYAGAILDRKSTIEDVTIIKEWEDRMERAATTASSLEAEHDSGSGPRCQDTILGGVEAQIRFEAASKQSNDLPLSRVNTLGSGEDNNETKGSDGILYKTT